MKNFRAYPERLREVNTFLYVVDELRRRSRWLRTLNEAACNGDLTVRQKKREARIEKECQELVARISISCLKVYFQGDPRGCAVYLIPTEWTDDEAASNYSSGVAIY